MPTEALIRAMDDPKNWGDRHARANILNDGRGRWGMASDDTSNCRYHAIGYSVIEACFRGLMTFKGQDGQLIISPKCARMIADTREMKSYREMAVYNFEHCGGPKPTLHPLWGSPETLYGLRVIVEDLAGVFGHSALRSYVKSDNTAVILWGCNYDTLASFPEAG